MRRFLILLSVLFLVSCRAINPSQMLRAPKDYNYATYSDSLAKEYKIAPDDVLSFIVLPNKGGRLVSGVTELAAQSNQTNEKNTLNYIVEADSTVKLPLLGKVKFGGLTRLEAEKMLEEKYSAYINDPYVKLSVDNRRVFVFTGTGAVVIKLENQNTTLYEVLAQAGGMVEAKAHKIKLVRRENGVSKVYLFDLSRVENLQQGNLVLQSNDMVYITPRDRTSEKVFALVTPYLSLLATIFAAIAIFK